MTKHNCTSFKTVAKGMIIRCRVCGTYYAIKDNKILEALRPIMKES